MNTSAPQPLCNLKEANMRKALTAALAALTLGGAVCATAVPAQAQRFRGDFHHHGDRGGAAVAAGVLGLALGAAIASDHRSYYGPGYYYGGPYAYGYDYPYYRTCVTTRWVWDPYIGRRVPVRQPYAC
jgi:hypothetical protein